MQSVKFETQTKKIVLCALLTATVALATSVFRIPLPLVGYINLGDAFVLLAAYLLGPVYGAVASGIGAALADFLAGYTYYVPGTFAIKALTAVAAYFIYRALSKAFKRDFIPLVVAGIIAEIVMAGGYFFYESVCLGYSWAAAANIPFNLIQGAFGVVLSVLVAGVLFGRNIVKRPFDKLEDEDEDSKDEKMR